MKDCRHSSSEGSGSEEERVVNVSTQRHVMNNSSNMHVVYTVVYDIRTRHGDEHST
jgi:hypothetical protein